MDTEGMDAGETRHQGEFEKLLDHLVESKQVSGNLLKRGTPISCSAPDEFFWNSIGSQESAEA